MAWSPMSCCHQSSPLHTASHWDTVRKNASLMWTDMDLSSSHLKFSFRKKSGSTDTVRQSSEKSFMPAWLCDVLWGRTGEQSVRRLVTKKPGMKRAHNTLRTLFLMFYWNTELKLFNSPKMMMSLYSRLPQSVINRWWHVATKPSITSLFSLSLPV